jgi:hypothetical protein
LARKVSHTSGDPPAVPFWPKNWLLSGVSRVPAAAGQLSPMNSCQAKTAACVRLAFCAPRLDLNRRAALRCYRRGPQRR